MATGRTARLSFARAALACALAAFGTSAFAQGDSLEYPIKATFLIRFGAYVQWPEAAFGSRSSPLELCVVGRDPFGPILDQLAGEERVGERTLAVRRLAADDDPGGCHVLYVGRLSALDDAALAGRIDGRPMLVVTDAAQSAGAYGAIHFVVVDDRVRFRIDEAAAERSQLDLSSQLLSVALSVQRSETP